MAGVMIFSTILITLALVCYSIHPQLPPVQRGGVDYLAYPLLLRFFSGNVRACRSWMLPRTG